MVIPGFTFPRKRRIRRVSLERAKLPGKLRVRAEIAPLGQPVQKAGLLILHGLLLLLLILWASPAPMAAQTLFGLAILIGSLHYLLGLFLLRFHREVLDQFSRCLAAAGISAVFLVGTRLILFGGWTATFLPVSVATLLFTLVLSQRFAFSVSLFLLTCMGLILKIGGREPLHDLVVLAGGAVVAALTVGRVRKRSTLIRAGLFIGIAHAVVGTGLLMFQSTSFAWDAGVFYQLAWYVGHGFLVGFLVSGLLPVVEFLFGVTTDVSLLELSNQNEQPVLRKLLIEAPGTFHHSFIVGLLAEAAAERIGAHGLLCRVGAYFHDIGKMVKPHYYAENTHLGQSSHTTLSPEMSALVIASHPKDSLELADYYDLPTCLRPFMTEHHGTSKIEYFYHRALERANDKGTTVDEAGFRYPGPRPQSKETAIVMLADTVEAAARSLKNPTAARISAVVNDLIMKKLQDGQLDECPLTLRDIKDVENAFTATLIGIHHARPSYPAPPPVAATAEAGNGN